MDKYINYLEKFFMSFMLIFSAISATMLLPSLYLLKSSYSFKITDINWLCITFDVIIILGVPLLMSFLSLLWMKSRGDDHADNVSEIEPVNNEYLPIYLGYIFVSLSMPNPESGNVDWLLLSIVWILLVIFVSRSKSLTFNPLFVVFGYGYYRVKTLNNVKIYIATRQIIGKSVDTMNFSSLAKVNELFYIEK